ncbi:MAG: hypothetical protein IKR75_06440 [Fibrobacter sp.]|nr:hypothetical protein [Fibrobacter sp.]
MKLFSILFLAASFALVACGDDSSSSSAPPNENGSDSPSKPKYDCTVKGGVKVLYPAGGETFHLGDTITVVYGSDVQGSGYRFIFKVNEEDLGKDAFPNSVGPEEPDGKTCYEQKIVLSKDFAKASNEAIIRVAPYERQNKGADSEPFKVKE